MSKRVADVLVETLQAAGVKRCYGIVGDTLNRIAEAIDKSDITWVHMRHEEAGAFAAGAEAQLTGNITACAGSCGPGSVHFINGIYEANRNRSPVVLIATQIIRQDIGFQSVQEVDFKKVYADSTVFCEMIITPKHARRMAVAACQAAITMRGVAVLIVPVDISNSPAEDELSFAVHARRPVVRPADADLDEIADLLNASKTITIYAGAGCLGAHDEVMMLAERLQAPVAHTSRGKDVLEYDNPFDVGMSGIIGQPAGYRAVLDCDTLLVLGCDFAWSQFYPKKARIIQIDAEATHIGRRHPVTIGVVGDIKPSVEALLPRIKEHGNASFLNKCLERRRKDVEEAAAETVSDPNGAVPGSYLAKMVNKHAAADALFAADDGTALVWTFRHVVANGKRRVLGSLLHGTMADAMPAAIGLQKAAPDRQVVCMAGDGGFTMLMGDLLTVKQEKVPIKIVVFNNGKLAYIDIEQKSQGIDPTFTDLENPDFGKVAQAMGIWGRCVTKAGELEEAVVEWLAQPGPALLDVHVHPMQLVMPPSPLASPEAVVGLTVYTAKAMLHGKGHDVWEMIVENT